MAQAKRGVPLSEAHKRACSVAQKERHARDGVSEATRLKMSEALKGKKRPDTAARNKAAAGWKHTDEAKAKIAEASRTGGFKGKSHSDATRALIRDARSRQEPTCGMEGKKQSEETRRKISEGVKRAWALRKRNEVV